MRNAIRGLISPGERYIKENKIKDICEDDAGWYRGSEARKKRKKNRLFFLFFCVQFT